MRNFLPIVVLSIVVVFSNFGNGAAASSPVHVSVGLFRPILPLDSRTANRDIRVVYEHHKGNRLLRAVCDGTVTTSSERAVRGEEKKGLSEEHFQFDLPDGMYICEAILVREGGEIFSDQTGEFPVMSLRRAKK